MRVITFSKGRAAEYSKMSLNLYVGCDHWCTYCYGPDATRLTPEVFRRPRPKLNALHKLELDARDLAGDKDPVMLSFITDPYIHMDVKPALTRKAIEILHAHNLRVRILTKAGFRSQRDLDLLTDRDFYGTTLTFESSLESYRVEPRAAQPNDRIAMLSTAHALGIPTWVSLEPIINLGETLRLIDRTHKFVDEFKVGKLNYVPSEITWNHAARAVINRLIEYDCAFYIKSDLLNYCPQGTPQRREKGQRVRPIC